MTNLTVFISGNRIEIPYGVIEIAHGCSGLRYFEIGLALSIFAVQYEHIPFKLKFLIVVFGGVLALITNWIRVIGLIFIGYNSKMTSSLMADHEMYGFLLFFFVISGVIFLTNKLAKKHSLATSRQESITTPSDSKLSSAIVIRIFTLVISVQIFTHFLSDQFLNIQKNNLATNTVNSDINVQSSTFNVINTYGNYQQNLSSKSINNRNCTIAERTYNFITPGADILPYRNVVNESIFTILSRSKIPLKEFVSLEAVHLKLEDRQLNEISDLYYWYEYNGYTITNNYVAKLFEISYLFNSETKMKMHVLWCSK